MVVVEVKKSCENGYVWNFIEKGAIELQKAFITVTNLTAAKPFLALYRTIYKTFSVALVEDKLTQF